MKSHLSCDPFNVEEEGGGEMEDSFAINGVVSVQGINWFV